MLICRGLPGSGKSTWATKYLEMNREKTLIAYINKDTIRAGMSPNHEEIDERLVHSTMMDQIGQAIELKTDILVDNMHLKERDVRQLTKIAEENGYHVEIYDFRDVPLETCLARNAARSRVVPEDVIRNYHKRYIAGRF